VGANSVSIIVVDVVENVLMHGGAKYEHVLNGCMPELQYVRKTQPRRASMKNGDAQIRHLSHHVLHYRVIRDCGHCGTNWRRTKYRVSPITKQSDMPFKFVCHRFDCQLGSWWH
jgi:hypothetical protein